MTNQRAFVSLHDVMPETLPRVEEILSYCKQNGLPPITLLIVPGRAWGQPHRDRLRSLADAGYPLAAHGWFHHVANIRGWYHRLHAGLVSRDVAEHLALDSAGIRDLMLRSCAWFAENQLPAPNLYVPPAWALGRIQTEHLAQIPVDMVEILRGLLHAPSGRLYRCPMVGFEAKSLWQLGAVRLWNTQQAIVARTSGRPLRIGIHPQDFRLPLAKSLRRFLEKDWSFEAYSLPGDMQDATINRPA